MVRERESASLEPEDASQPWKGEAAADLVHTVPPVAARYRPPAPATGACFWGEFFLVTVMRVEGRGLKPRTLFIGLIGANEFVPCYKASYEPLFGGVV